MRKLSTDTSLEEHLNRFIIVREGNAYKKYFVTKTDKNTNYRNESFEIIGADDITYIKDADNQSCQVVYAFVANINRFCNTYGSNDYEVYLNGVAIGSAFGDTFGTLYYGNTDNNYIFITENLNANNFLLSSLANMTSPNMTSTFFYFNNDVIHQDGSENLLTFEYRSGSSISARDYCNGFDAGLFKIYLDVNSNVTSIIGISNLSFTKAMPDMDISKTFIYDAATFAY